MTVKVDLQTDSQITEGLKEGKKLERRETDWTPDGRTN
jgi:hypothetical protein